MSIASGLALGTMHQKPQGFDTLEEVADAIASYQPHRARPKSLAGLAKNVRVDANGKFRWHWDPRFLAREIDVEKRLRRYEACARSLRLPVLLVRGGLSDVLTEEGAREFLALCPHVRGRCGVFGFARPKGRELSLNSVESEPWLLGARPRKASKFGAQ